MVETGLLTAGKFELVEGEVVYKMGLGRLHIIVVARIIAVLTAIFGEAVQSQAQIGIGEIDEFNDPEPDVAVLKGTLLNYKDREPDPATEVILAVEAANTSLPGDITVKSRLYSRFGLPEYWVVDMPHRQLIVCRQPSTDGYLEVKSFEVSESVAPLAAPDSPILVSALLP